MKHLNLFLALFLLSGIVSNGYGQNVSFEDDEKERGYYNRPYLRYEAESGKCKTNGVLLNADYDQRLLQSEASNQSALQLIAPDSYVEWNNQKAADGITIRFSIPDGADGKGTKGKLALFVDNVFIRHIELDSYWAWQYFRKNDENKYPDNTPAATSFARMRFDEMHLKLDAVIPAGAVIKLSKADKNDAPYTIDFIELEKVSAPVSYESIPDKNKVRFEGGNLEAFIGANQGKTIYIPQGKHLVSNRIYLREDNTKLIGAGMWYTELFFDASSDEVTTHSHRGIETNNNNIHIEGLYLNTINCQRYYQSESKYQVGKGLMGSFGTNSVIKNVWVEHFECGAWIANYGSNSLLSENLLVQHCRFRGNYADGINLCRGTSNAVVEYCSFRNNGDDDMASWSSSFPCGNNTFRYCTAENNWRASSLGIFGGENNKAHHIVIADGMENGIRINGDFNAKEGVGNNIFSDISVYRCGAIPGTPGEKGDLWGNGQAAVLVATSNRFDLKDIQFINIDVYDSRNDAIQISGSANSKEIIDLRMKNISISGAGRYAVYFSSAKGNGAYCNFSFSHIGGNIMNPSGDQFRIAENCETGER